MALREMLASFKVAVEGLDELDTVDKKFDEIREKLSGFGPALAAYSAVATIATVAALRMVPALAEQGNEIDKISQRLGVSSDELQQWRYMAEQTGAKANDLTLAFKMLSQHLADSANGQKNKGFDHLGLQLRDAAGNVRPVIDVMGDLADKVANTKSEAEKTALALHTMGKGGIGMLPLLKMGRAGVERLTKRFHELGGGFSPEFVQEAAKAKGAFLDLSWASRSLKDHIGVQLFPAVTWITNKLADLAAVTGKVVHNTQTMKTLMVSAGVASTYTGVKLASGIIQKLGLVTKIAGETGYSVLNTAKAFGKLGWEATKIGLKIALLFLILEDFYTFMTGGDSVIGSILDGWFGEGTQEKVRAWFQDIFPAFMEAVKAIAPVLQFMAVQTALFLKDLFSGFKGYGTMFSEFFEFLWADVKAWWTKISDEFVYAFDHIGELIKNFRKNHPIIDGIISHTVGESSIASGVRDVASGAANAVGNIIQNNVVDIAVSTSDPAAAAQQVLKGQKNTNNDNAATMRAIAKP